MHIVKWTSHRSLYVWYRSGILSIQLTLDTTKKELIGWFFILLLESFLVFKSI